MKLFKLICLFVALVSSFAFCAESKIPQQYTNSKVFVNLGDYAKGDGSDETEGIQKAFDALVSLKKNWKPHLDGYPHRKKRGVLWIPSPAKFYGFSRTIKVYEKWNVEIKCETPSIPAMQIDPYFVWLGPDKGTMFNFNYCGAINVENLSMSGRGKHVTGIMVGQENQMHGFFKLSSFSQLYISDVAVGMRLGGNPNNGADIAVNSYRDVTINNFSEIGLIGSSGNLATQTFINLSLSAGVGAKHGVAMYGGQIVLMNSCLGGGPSKVSGAAVAVFSGGINIYGCWSEWRGPFLYGNPQCPQNQSRRVDSAARYSTILQGIQHYPGAETQFWKIPGSKKEKPESENPVPISIDWDRPTPLTLVNCSFFGGVKLGKVGQSSIISIGTTFSNRDGLRFCGEGIERYGRLVQIGTLASGTRDVVDPYVIDRRNTPGTAAPTEGVWKKGDRILNTDPNPSVSAKAYAGWICVEAGEPGMWAPYGKIGEACVNTESE